MTVLVTGGTGYIGSHTCVELLNLGHDVVIVDSLVNSNAEALNRIRMITGKRPLFYQMDVRDEVGLSQVFRAHSFDCVIHFAGLKSVEESVRKPALYYDNNLNSTITLCRVMAKYGVKRLIFSSSATVYSGDNQMPLTEEAKTGNCTNPYGWTKYICERILTDLASADPDWSIVLLRYFNPAGAHESGLIGEDPLVVPNDLIPYLAQVAAGRRSRLSAFGGDYPTHNGGKAQDYIHVVDLALGHVAAIDYLMDHTGTEVFNLGTGAGDSVSDMVRAFEEANGVELPYQVTSRRPEDLPLCYADPAKSARVLGWKAERSLVDMCRDSFHWQTQNPDGYGTWQKYG